MIFKKTKNELKIRFTNLLNRLRRAFCFLDKRHWAVAKKGTAGDRHGEAGINPLRRAPVDLRRGY